MAELKSEKRGGLGVADTLPGEGPTRAGDVDARELEKEVARESIRAQLFQTRKAPRSFGRYLLQRRLGSGGMGIVFAARDPELDRDVAIKILRPELRSAPAGDTARLLREARAIARLSHPNVIVVHDVGVHGELVYVVMELVRGESLREWMSAGHDWLEIVDVLMGAGEGLAAAHAAGLVHRDFKPQNVLIGEDDRPRVLDFGLARPLDECDDDGAGLAAAGVEAIASMRTASGAIIGTPSYMAPEQFVGAPADERSDQFALCVTLFEALFGRRPFAGDTMQELCEQLLHAPLEFPAGASVIPAAVRDVLARGLSRRREERFPDITALLEALAAATAPFRSVGTPSERFQLPSARRAREAERFPHVRAYLDGLPAGLHSHADCRMRASIVRVATRLQPPGESARLPAEVVAALRSRPHATGWLREVPGRVILAALRDLHFSDDASFSALLGRARRGVLSAEFFTFTTQPPTSPRAIQAATRAWTSFHTGGTLIVDRVVKGGAAIVVEHPTGLLGPLGQLDLLATLRAALELSGARLTDLRVVEASDEHVELSARWA
ncbi:MAG: serine/threonine protein kinase [Myxococcales bacterium]|nr:serine/threonine protein kinase [Myxococcales bacterium]